MQLAHPGLLAALGVAAGIALTVAFIFATVWFEDWRTFSVKGKATPEDWQKKWEVLPKDEIMAFCSVAQVDVHWNQSAGGFVLTRQCDPPNREHILVVVGYFADMDEWKKAVEVVRTHNL